ncbi:MAG: GNAT family N-acetyltransferase [Clostridia bacterium]|nr:GNAT family N-acetyltransferase [Clostridia bacterium]
MKKRTQLLFASVSALLFGVLIVLIKFVDVRPIGPENTSVGLAGLNSFVFGLFGVNFLWYEITDWLGFAALFVASGFALAGFIQLIKRKSLFKVDSEIITLGFLYLAVIGVYVLFEHAVVNFRPVIMPGAAHPEASFPSSHTMLVCVILGSAPPLFDRYVKNAALCKTLKALCAAVVLVTVAGRIISGVHWFTDVVGAVFISLTFLFIFSRRISSMNRNAFIIRPERKDEYRKVENLVRESFWNVYRPGCSEHYVLHVLRDDPAFVKELDFVMEKDGEVIGQNMFMRTVINSDAGSDVPVLTMGPICIAPEFKRQGFGKALLDYSLEKAASLGYGAVLFEGNVLFYGKSGFDYARKFGIRYHDLPEGEDDSFFLCRELVPGYLDGVTGVYQTPKGYYVPDAGVEEFDKGFPPKVKLKLPGQLFD